QHFQSKLLESAAGEAQVGLELLEQCFLALLLEVLRLSGVGHVPAVLGLRDQARIILLQSTQVLVVGGKVTMNLARDISSALVLQEVVLQQCHELRLGLMFLPASAKLGGELWMNLLVGRRPAL